jgi:small redox-active disulfide protein 2
VPSRREVSSDTTLAAAVHAMRPWPRLTGRDCLASLPSMMADDTGAQAGAAGAPTVRPEVAAVAEIRVIGPGCPRCRQTYVEVERAVALAGKPAHVIMVEDVRELIPHRVVSTPAVVMDGRLRCAGRVPRADEIAGWLRPAEEPARVMPGEVKAREGSGGVPSRPLRSLAVFLALSLLGLALSIVLAVLHRRAYAGTGPSFCAAGAELNCDAVALSAYSVFLGAPVAVWGALAYSAMAAIALSGFRRGRSDVSWPGSLLLPITAGAVLASLGLWWVSKVQVRATCLLCAACWAVNGLLFLTALRMSAAIGGPSRSVAGLVRAIRRRPLVAAAFLVGLAIAVTAVGSLYPRYWAPAD